MVEQSLLATKKIFFFDTETSGFINKKLPADHSDQAWCIQIGGILTNNLGEDLETLNILIKPESRSMHPRALETHGITLEYAQEHGLPELEAANLFGTILRKADLVVCHNYEFDWTHVTAMLERNMDNLSDEARSAFYLDIPYVCTMKAKEIIKFCGLKNKTGRPKWPKLVELHEILFDESFEGQHDALSDILATKKCFFELAKIGLITIE